MTTGETAFSFDGVSKSFKSTLALHDVSFAIPRGSVVGLIGRNGAGKSTAIRCLLGLQRPSAGQVRLLGEDPWRLSVAAKQRLGSMVDGGLPFPNASPRELFDFCAPLYPDWDARIEAQLCQRFAIDRGTKLHKLSLGQQRAVALALALCPRPEVLVLDEPAANLDPVMRREFLGEVLALVAEPGRTVLFSSHNLSDVERIADRIVFLHEGRVRLHRPIEELREQVRRVRLVFPHQAPAQMPIPGALAIRRSERELLVTVDGFDVRSVSALEAATGARIEVLPVGLEDLFLDLAGGEGAAIPQAAWGPR